MNGRQNSSKPSPTEDDDDDIPAIFPLCGVSDEVAICKNIFVRTKKEVVQTKDRTAVGPAAWCH